MTKTRQWVGAALALGLCLATSESGAEPADPRPSDGVFLPWRSISFSDDASAIQVNPANIVRMPGPEGRITVVYTPDAAPLPLRGIEGAFAVPFWILGTGLRFDLMEPSGLSPDPFGTGGSQRYAWVRWGNAISLGDFASVGTTFAWSSSDSPSLHDFFSVTSALTVRPNRFVSAAAVVRDWNTPSAQDGTEIEPSVDFGAAFRPLDGDRFLELGLEASYRAGDDAWVPTANAAVDLPYIGRFRAGASLLDPREGEVLVSAGIELNLDRLQVTGGALFGNALGVDGTGFVVGAAVRGFDERPGVPKPSRFVRFRIESSPGLREHVTLLRRLWKLADDDEVAGVLFELRASPAPSLSHAEELVDAIELLKRRGKKVLCHLEDASGRELFVCSAADRVAVNPAGGIRFAGLSTRYFYLGGLMNKLGIRADFVRIGDHKLAPEQFREGSSAVAKDDHRELLEEYERIYLGQIARGRKMSPSRARATIEKGPFIAPEAREANLVDQLVYEDEIDRFVEESFGSPVGVVDYAPATEQPRTWRDKPKIAVVYLEGAMMDGKSQTIPLIGIQIAGSYTIRQALEEARTDPSIKAVVFRIESGGGSSLASDVIHREASLLAQKKPLVVSMGGAAASGGYYAAVPGDPIFANASTITGSIGIYYGKVDVAQLLDKLSIRTESQQTAPRADAETLFRPFNDSERAELGRKVKQFYDLFVGRVAEGRKMSVAEVDAVARGKVWTGAQAYDKKLIDEIGGLRQALDKARELGDLSDDAPLVMLPRREQTLLDFVLGLIGIPTFSAEASLGWVPPPVMDVARALIPFTIFDPARPLALMELMVVE